MGCATRTIFRRWLRNQEELAPLIPRQAKSSWQVLETCLGIWVSSRTIWALHLDLVSRIRLRRAGSSARIWSELQCCRRRRGLGAESRNRSAGSIRTKPESAESLQHRNSHFPDHGPASPGNTGFPVRPLPAASRCLGLFLLRSPELVPHPPFRFLEFLRAASGCPQPDAGGAYVGNVGRHLFLNPNRNQAVLVLVTSIPAGRFLSMEIASHLQCLRLR